MHMNAEIALKRPIMLQRLTGLTREEFLRVHEKFAEEYQRQVIQPRLEQAGRRRGVGGGRRGEIPESADKLVFILSYARIYPLLFIQGMLYGMDESRACVWVKTLLPVLDETMGTLHLRPKQAKGKSLEEIVQEFPELRELGIVVDGVERPIRRPKDAAKQEEQYSGKKKRHTTKRVTLTHPQTQYILAVSQEYPGSVHDKKILDDEGLSASEPIPVKADSGFQGLVVGAAQISTPHKKKRKKKGEPKDELSPQQKQENKELSQQRISIEHSNAGFKRNRSAADIFRNMREGCGELFTNIAMALHNLRVTSRTSYQHA